MILAPTKHIRFVNCQTVGARCFESYVKNNIKSRKFLPSDIFKYSVNTYFILSELKWMRCNLEINNGKPYKIYAEFMWDYKTTKKTVTLLSIGVVLEYFDLMLYVHMSTLLNEVFFPQDNPFDAELFATFTFCATFILRPVGAIVIGGLETK